MSAVSKNKLLLSDNYKDYRIQKENYNLAMTTADLNILDYQLAKTFNSNNVAYLMRRSEYTLSNLGLNDRSQRLEEEFYDFTDTDDVSLITAFIDQILDYTYNYCLISEDKYRVLNYTAFMLVNEGLDVFYYGKYLPLSLLMQELRGYKILNKKLKYTDIAESISRFRMIRSKEKFEEIIAIMRKYIWK